MAIQRNFGRGKTPASASLGCKVEGMTIMGIDPGTNFMGYGVIKIEKGKASLITYGTIKLNATSDPYEKLKAIFVQVGVIIEEFRPDEIALEAPFYGVNPQSMLKLGRAQGVAMAAALSRSIDVFEYAPTEVKQAISGRGRASKEQVADMICRLLEIDENFEKLDATDALAVAMCHFFEATSPIPKKQRSKGFKAIAEAQQKTDNKGAIKTPRKTKV